MSAINSASDAALRSFTDRSDGTTSEDIRHVARMESELKTMARVVASARSDATSGPLSERGSSGSYVSEASIMKAPEDLQTRASTVRLHGAFIGPADGSHELSIDPELGTWSRRLIKSRYLVLRCLRSSYANAFLGIVIFFDVVLSCNTIDSNAMGQEPPLWVTVSSSACFAVYVTELAAVLFCRRMSALTDGWVQLDIVIVLGGSADLIVQVAGMESSGLGIVRLLRLLRVVRLVSMLRKIVFLKELRKLAKMLVSCMKTLLWSFLFCFLCMTFWAMLAVDLVHPLMEDMIQKGYWPGCLGEQKEHYCDALSSIMRANLTLFKTIVAGDSWGVVAEPMIAVHPWTAIIFAGSLMTIVFAVLNLVVAAVVDEFAEQRVRDVNSIAQEMEENQQEDLKFLEKVFEKIDEDGSGELSLEELIYGAKKVPEFRSRLRVMDIDEDDLQQLFYMLDEDLSGAIAPDEFMSALSRWLNESKTASRFVKYNVMKTMNQQNDLFDLVRQRLDRIDKQLRHVMTSQKDVNTEMKTLHQEISEAGSNAAADMSHTLGNLSATGFLEGCQESQTYSSLPDKIAAGAPARHDEQLGLQFAKLQASTTAPWLSGMPEASQEPKTFVDSLYQTLRGAQENLLCVLQTARLVLAESARAETGSEQRESLAALERMVQMLGENVVPGSPSSNQLAFAQGIPAGVQDKVSASEEENAAMMLRVLV